MEHHPVPSKGCRFHPSQGTYPGCRFNFWVGSVWEAADVFLSPSFSLKTIFKKTTKNPVLLTTSLFIHSFLLELLFLLITVDFTPQGTRSSKDRTEYRLCMKYTVGISSPYFQSFPLLILDGYLSLHVSLWEGF